MTSSKKPDTAPSSKPSELSPRQRYLLHHLSEAGLLVPLLEDLKRNIKREEKAKPSGEA